MELFSQRKGIKPVKNVMQVDNIDDDLRNGLWNALNIYWNKMESNQWLSYHQNIYFLFKFLWHDFFKKPIDTLNDKWSVTYRSIREYYFNCSWFEVYDFIEFVSNNYPDKLTSEMFNDFCNNVLERELSAYRFVDGKITQMTLHPALKKAFDSLYGYTSNAEGIRHALLDEPTLDFEDAKFMLVSCSGFINYLLAKSSKAGIKF